MRDDKQRTVKIELLSQWKLEAEFRNNIFIIWYTNLSFKMVPKINQVGP